MHRRDLRDGPARSVCTTLTMKKPIAKLALRSEVIRMLAAAELAQADGAARDTGDHCVADTGRVDCFVADTGEERCTHFAASPAG